MPDWIAFLGPAMPKTGDLLATFLANPQYAYNADNLAYEAGVLLRTLEAAGFPAHLPLSQGDTLWRVVLGSQTAALADAATPLLLDNEALLAQLDPDTAQLAYREMTENGHAVSGHIGRRVWEAYLKRGALDSRASANGSVEMDAPFSENSETATPSVTAGQRTARRKL